MVITNDRTIVSREEAEKLLYQTAETSSPSGFANLETAQKFNYSPLDTTSFDDLVSQYQSAPAVQEYSAPAQPSSSPALEGYITNSQQLQQRPEFDKTFRPQLFDETLQKVDFSPAVEMEKIAEVEIVPAKVAEYNHEESTDQVVRLNARGIIAVASFFAILTLITVLVIINAVNLGNSGARIDGLRASNAEMRQELSVLNNERQQFLNSLTEDQLREMGLQQLPVINIQTPSNTWQHPQNPDQSTNWFDSLSRFLSGLFR